MAYILLLIWMLFCYMFVWSNKRLGNEQREKTYYVLFFLGCTFLMGFRSEKVGVDTERYKQLFEMMQYVSFKEMISETIYNRRIGYMALMKAVGFLDGNYYTFQFLISVIFNYNVYKFISNNTRDPFLASSVFLGCGLYLSAMNVQRETFAVVLLLRAWDLVNEKKQFKALIISIFAVSCHTTALICILAYVIYLLKDNKLFLKVAPIVVLLGALNYQRLIGFFSTYFVSYSNYYKNKKTLTEAGGVTIIWGVILILSFYCIYNKKKFSNIERVYGIFCIICIITDILGMYFNYLDRLGPYFILFEILLIDSIANHFDESSFRKVYKFGVSFSFLAYFLLSALTSVQYQYTSFV